MTTSPVSSAGACLAPSIESTDDAARFVGESAKRGDYRFISKPDGGLVELYVKKRLCIAVCESFGISGGCLCQDGFIIQALHDDFPALDAHALDSAVRNQESSKVYAHSGQALMLADDVQLVHGPNGIIPSLIRFQCFNFGNLGLTKPLFAFNVIDGILQVGGARSDWKVSAGARLFAVSLCEDRSENIQTTADAVDDSCGQLTRKFGLKRRYQEIISGLRVFLDDDLVWAACNPSSQFGLDGLNLGYGPINGGLSV